jgi:hypothetical protein
MANGFVFPAFQAQNPAISGYPLGWASCTAFAGAMAAAFDRQVSKVMTGGQLRTATHDTSGGLTLAQIDAALLSGWDINVATSYGMAWDQFAAAIDRGQGAILQGGYAPIADSRFDAGGGFRGNHAVLVLPGWIVMDPLADGRRVGIYKYRGEAYPQSLLRSFAGKLNLDPSGYRALGLGKAYVSLTHDRVAAWAASVQNRRCGIYTVIDNTVVHARVATNPLTFSAPCTPPRLYRWPGHTSQSLVKISGGSHDGMYIRATYAHEV